MDAHYRYFDFIDEVSRNGELKFTPDEANMISGLVTNDKDQPVRATVFLINNTVKGKALKLQTGPDGQFYFPNLAVGSNYLLIARSLHRTEPIKILVQRIPTKHLRIDAKFPLLPPAPQPQKVNLAINFGNRGQALDEVIVVGYGAMRKRDLIGSVATVAAGELNAFPPGGVLQALQGKVAGLNITPTANPGETPLIRIRGAKDFNGGNEPLIVIDGVPQEKYDLSNLNVYDIESITVLKDAVAVAQFGARAANGVISIQTTPLRNARLRFNLTRHSQYTSQYFNLNGPAFTVARRFYVPQYKSTVTDERSDFRETIYWNPVVQTDRDGKATVEFYNSDATTTFRAIAEGIGYNGWLGRADTTYTARAAMSVDAKIPPYLTVGDDALIPVVIKNNSVKKLEAAIGISLPDNMYTGSFEHAVTLDPGASKQVLIPLSATAPANGNAVRISALPAILATKRSSLPISATGKGFPVIETFSGNSNAKHDLQDRANASREPSRQN